MRPVKAGDVDARTAIPNDPDIHRACGGCRSDDVIMGLLAPECVRE